jgi:hypothetical protein
MAEQTYKIRLNSRLVPVVQQMHQQSRVGGPMRGRGESLEAYLSDLVTTAIVERKQPCRSMGIAEKKTLIV